MQWDYWDGVATITAAPFQTLAGVPMFVWDNNAKDAGNESNGYIDHADGSWLNDSKTMVPTMLKACTSTDASYTFQSIWAKAPAAE